LQSFEAIEKWFAVVVLAINYLQYCAMLTYKSKMPLLSLADCKRQHQHSHFQALLRTLINEIKKQPQQVEAILQSFLPLERVAT
jgi:hypothetical protein